MRRLVIQLGSAEPERIAAALTIGLAAVASGGVADLWLSGPATTLAVPGREPAYELEHAPDLTTALDMLTSVVVCSQCAARRGLTEVDLRDGARIGGATELVEALTSDDAVALTY